MPIPPPADKPRSRPEVIVILFGGFAWRLATEICAMRLTKVQGNLVSGPFIHAIVPALIEASARRRSCDFHKWMENRNNNDLQD
jgi:hypothetical protein